LAGAGLAILPETAIFSDWIFVILAGVIMIFVFASRLKIMVIFAIIAGMIFGLWRGTLARVDLDGYENFIGQEVILRGKVKEDPNFGASGDLRVTLSDVEMILKTDYEKLDGEVEDLSEYFSPMAGDIWTSVSARGVEIKRSYVIEISGKLKAGFGTFPATMSFASLENIESSPDEDPARDVRDAFGEKLHSVISLPESDLGMGILAGQKTALPFELTAAFMATSLTHIVVASGYNLTILVRFTRRLFSKISRFAALSFGGILVFAFACVTGFSPSMTRASLVAGLSLLAWYYGRKFHAVTLILFTAAITIAINPTQIWGDAGWYMSFLSFTGVLIFAPLVKNYFWGNEEQPRISIAENLWYKFRKKYFAKKNFVAPIPREPSFTIRQVFIETLSAQIMAAPIIALFMGQFAPYGLLANILVLPIVPLAMLLTFIAGIGAFILPHSIAVILAQPANWLLNYVIEIAKWISGFSGANQEITIGGVVIVVIYVLLLGAIIYMKHKTKYSFRDDNIVK
jgi:competence protein ComEC